MFAQTADQELFEATTAQYLTRRYPSARIRELRADTSTFDRVAWKQGAELGWTSLLVPEAAGGGAISGNGLLDLMIVAFQFGRHAAPGPLLGANAVALALGRWGSPAQQEGPLAELLAGSATAGWAGPASAVASAGSGDDVVLNGTLRLVEGAADADHLLVSSGGAQPSQYLVPLSAPGVELRPLEGLDLTRRFQRVTLRDVRLAATHARVGAPGAGVDQDAQLLDVVAVLQSGEIVGAMHRAFEITLQWTFDRYSFGRPLASYQEIKHRIADLRTQLEASAAVAARAARAVGEQAPDAATWAAAAKSYAGRYGPEVIQDCMQLHGGIGVTFEHDLHLLLRRAATDAQLFGTPEESSRRVAQLVEIGAGAGR